MGYKENKKYLKRCLYGLYVFIYLPWFFTLEHFIQPDMPGIHILNKASDKEFVQFALSLIIGMSLALTICMIYPNGLTLRPSYIPDNICGKIVKGLYKTDTSTNVFPSIHVYNSLAVHIALAKCEALKNKPAVRYASLVLCILICMSTIFLKQHL